MDTKKWKFAGEIDGELILAFPFDWDEAKIRKFIGSGFDGKIRVCPECGKVDVLVNHFSTCDPIGERARQENADNYWK